MNLMVFNFLSIVHYSITLLCGRVMLLCAGILGRFYTDWHDVDENERTNVSQGGMWTRGNQAGIALRYITDTSSHTSDTVASLKNK